MILDQLYKVVAQEKSDNELNYRLSLDAAHDIFKGHFPGQPVLPGVCQMQIILELLSEHFDQKVEIEKSRMIKFSAMIDPRKTPIFNLKMKLSEVDSKLSISATITEEEITFLKLSAQLKRSSRAEK